ncbi:sigma-70 domain-containing protein [Clostridium sp. HBUAS56010]|uniref:sigma-70 domain-containing protein n=1 Tax=Clostridium sp. HBUAS56010 TaxID=2571127 RepID=UPI0011783584|nr:sigma-70 domain-containing protein [Clostridium sp. HBUAS56010]
MHDDFYQMYLEEMGEIAPCTKEEAEHLLREIKAGSQEAKKRLVEGNLQTALSLSKEFDGKGVLLTDLIQEANMALMMAVEEYEGDADKESFDKFAEERMRSAVLELLEEEVAAGQTGEELTARVNVLQQISQMLAGELGREATVEELAAKMKMSVEEIQGIMKMAMDAVSMNAENMDMEALAGIEGLEILEEETDGTDYEG